MEKLTKRFKTISYIGLSLVLVGYSIYWLPSIYRSILPTNFELRNYLMQGSDWVVVLMIILFVKYGEKNNLSTLNFKKIKLETFILGLALFGFSMLSIAGSHFLFKNFGVITGFEKQLDNPAMESVGSEFVFVYGIFSLLTAAFAEEIIYRGYVTERILILSKNKVWAYILPVIAFTLMHYRKGLDHLVGVIFVAVIMTIYYVKYRNLTLNIIGHFFIDLMAYISILYNHFTK